MKHEKEHSNSKTTTLSMSSLSPENRALLLQSICQFFEHNGFHKSLKKFSREAEVEKDSWKSCLLNLEEMCQEYIQMRNDPKASDRSMKAQDADQKDKGVNHVTSLETVKTKEKGAEDGEKSERMTENHPVDGDNVKSKKKKKRKGADDSSDQVIEESHSRVSEHPKEDTPSAPEETVKKSKDKKKKHKDESEAPNKISQDNLAEAVAGEISGKADAVSQEEKKGKSKSKKKKEDTTIYNKSVGTTEVTCSEKPALKENLQVLNNEVDKDKKGSKKRKKASSEDNEAAHVEGPSDDSKRRKTDHSSQPNGTVEHSKLLNGSANGVLEKDGGEMSQKRDKTNQLNGSAEPKSANAFRRVKPDEVEFVDERLQDNSYWAKDGAESGYGAKAQEVLGQVRGRDFRHEKTKKKRGSYRGGQIDLGTHSIKFNYDDDDDE